MRYAAGWVVTLAGMACLTSCGEDGGPLAPIPLDVGAQGSTVRVGRLVYVTSTRIDTIARGDGVVRPTLITRVNVRNEGSNAVDISHGACNVSVDAYRTPDRDGPPAWNYDLSEDWGEGYARACIAILLVTRIAPGEEKQIGVNHTPLIDILADSLSDGRYYLAARVGANVASGVLLLPAGEFDLAVARPPLRDSVRHGSLDYRASSVVLSDGGTVQTTVTAIMWHGGGMLISYPRECVLTLAAYRDRNRRDAAPRSGAPDWQQARACAPGDEAYSLHGGGLTFRENVPTADILGADRPDGEHYLAVSVRTPTRHLWLSAGRVELRR